MVADGMGGAAAGELASAMATDLIYRHLSTVWAEDEDASPARFAYRMKEAVELANQQIYGYAREHPEVRGMGTTVTAAGVFGDASVPRPDRRQPGLSGPRTARRSSSRKDQSLMQRLVDAGELTQEEAEQSERRNIILQALGPDPRVKVDLSHQLLRRGDTLLICSDGLSGLVKREEFADMVAAHADLTVAVHRADRPGQRAGRPGQHHGRGGPVRRRGLTRAGRGRRRGVSGVPGARQRSGGHPGRADRAAAGAGARAAAVAEPQPGRGRGLLIAVGLLVLAALLLLVLL